jgi:hypothetical protein
VQAIDARGIVELKACSVPHDLIKTILTALSDLQSAREGILRSTDPDRWKPALQNVNLLRDLRELVASPSHENDAQIFETIAGIT